MRLEEAEGVRTLRVQRPPHNVLDVALAQALDGALSEAEADGACRALVLAGTPEAFCAGLGGRKPAAASGRERHALEGAVNALMARLYGLACPSFAAITGPAYGVGLVLALACDLRLAAEGTYKLGLSEPEGQPFPEGALIVLRHELDPQTARRLVLTGRRFAPRDREAQSFVDRVIEPELLLERTRGWARELAARPGYAQRKRQLRAPGMAELERIQPRSTAFRARGPGGG